MKRYPISDEELALLKQQAQWAVHDSKSSYAGNTIVKAHELESIIDELIEYRKLVPGVTDA